MINQLIPNHVENVDVLEAITSEDRSSKSSQRPWVYMNMVSSLDGATALEGVSGGLGGSADGQVFSALRAQADVIIAGAETVRAESYRAPQTALEVQAQRESRGQAARPLIVVVSGSATLSPDLRLFDDPSYIPVLVTGSRADEGRLAALGDKVRVIRQEGDRVDLAEMLKTLSSEGHGRCLVEGGPTLNGQFISEGLVDEWNLTLSGVLASGNSSRAAHGPAPKAPQHLELVRLWEAEGGLFGRWLVGRD